MWARVRAMETLDSEMTWKHERVKRVGKCA